MLWVPSSIQETLVFVLTLRKLLQREQTTVSTLRTLLIRDGLIYYCGLMIWRFASIAVFAQGNILPMFEIGFCSVGFGGTLVSRLFLNLRNYGEQSHTIDLDDISTYDARWVTQVSKRRKSTPRNGAERGNRGTATEVLGMRDLVPVPIGPLSGHSSNSSNEDPSPPWDGIGQSRLSGMSARPSRPVSATASSLPPAVRVCFTQPDSSDDSLQLQRPMLGTQHP
ncbi:hypothetical protein DL93DRAFT_801600 [Clavulina sp. PMI_390]|nr:hypothetical protein DL93DRAFT_801600 [Clavulina sp. PMI_390]